MKPKTLLMVTAAALALSAAAGLADDPFKVVKSGKWFTYESKANSDGRPMCGMLTYWSDHRAFYVKYAQADDVVFFQAMKSSWRFPSKGVEVPMTIGVDKNPILEGSAIGVHNGDSPMVEFKIKLSDQWPRFVENFSEASQMWLRFQAGNEPTWTMEMNGSRRAITLMKGCMVKINSEYTQPYGDSGTQPYNKQPSRPAVKKDDGAI